MSKLEYTPKASKKDFPKTKIYKLKSIYDDKTLFPIFLDVKNNVADLNSALVVKCITGQEADFVLLMDRAKDYLNTHYKISHMELEIVLRMFRECIFEYYVLTPLIENPEVSDIKVLAWDHIVLKANGERYVSNLRFFSEKDYNDWIGRLLRIQRGYNLPEASLQHFTDRKGIDSFYLRIDVQLKAIVSTENNNIHIRKMPKTKLSWEYLEANGMLDKDIMYYLRDRILANYGFLISGRGGSGKSTLLNNLLDVIPFDESILVSQESDELYSNIHPQIQFEHTMTVSTKHGVKEFSLEDELRLGLLQDIDCFVIGEIKGGEALNVFTTAMSTGARFMGTIHSNDAYSSVIRLAQCARYVSDYPMETLLEMLTASPFVLIHMSRFSIDEIVEITGWDEEKRQLKTQTVFNKKFG